LATSSSPNVAPDPLQEGLGRLGSHWGLILFFGVMTLAAGITAVVWPGRTLLVIAVVFGFHLIFTGIYRLIGAFALPVEGGLRWVLAIGGVLGIIVGLLCLQNVIQTVAVLTIFLGFYWIFDGLVRTVSAISDSHMQGRGLAIASGLISAVAGTSVLAYPGSSLSFLTVVLGMWLIFFGVLEIVAAMRVRKLAKTVAVT
jgi:uncharacterized membrane protein HdeD (DUF308 family)